MTLTDFFNTRPKAALAYSGGVDSTYLLYAGVKSGADIRPYFVKTAFQPESELRGARELCHQLGVTLRVVELSVLSLPEVAANPADRCYYCKRALFTALREQSRADGYTVLLDGTNASDDVSDRPGMRALRELGVRSPLRECGMTKAEIRTRSQAAGLPTWNMPARACLATRIPTGMPITPDALQRVNGAEEALFQLGFSDLRVRMLGDTARIQLPEVQITRAAMQREKITEALRPFFTSVVLDFKPRSGMQ